MIQLSPSKLNLLLDCPRCFYDQEKLKLPRPRGIMSSVPIGMDSLLKKYFDEFRGALPPELERATFKVPGQLIADQALLTKWRNWRTGLTWEDKTRGIRIIGALDDCLVDSDIYIPLDYKTKGKKPESDGSEYYQTQLDIYELFLMTAKKKTAGKGILVYVYPIDILPGEYLVGKCQLEDIMPMRFGVAPFELRTNPDHALEVIDKAFEVLTGDRPDFNPACEYCAYIQNAIEFKDQKK